MYDFKIDVAFQNGLKMGIVRKRCLKCQVLKKVDEFYPKQNRCRECVKDYHREWYRNHIEQAREYGKNWRAAHIERVKELSKAWRFKNRAKVLAQSRLYRERHKKELSEKNHFKYRSKHPFPIRLSEAELKARRRTRYQRWGREQRENLTDFYVIQCLKKFGFKKVDCTPRMIAEKRKQLKKRQKGLTAGHASMEKS